jgi:hypothetical protein
MLQEQIRRKAMRDTTQSYHEELLCYMECREKIPPEKIPPIRWHFREQCTQCPFIPGREVVHCQLCKCFVCDLPAGKCSHWGPPHNHCKATYKALEWQRARCRSLHGLPPMMAPPMPKVERVRKKYLPTRTPDKNAVCTYFVSSTVLKRASSLLFFCRNVPLTSTESEGAFCRRAKPRPSRGGISRSGRSGTAERPKLWARRGWRGSSRCSDRSSSIAWLRAHSSCVGTLNTLTKTAT